MEGMITKTYRAEVRGVDETLGVVDLLIPVSTESMDRDGEIIEAEAWKKTLTKFKKRPILLASHDYRNLRGQIGEFAQLKLTEEGLLGKPKYYINEGNEEADWAFTLAKKGRAAFSVGFIPITWTDGDGKGQPRRSFSEVELLEVSQVVVPSNRDAIQQVRSKSVDMAMLELCDEVEKDLPQDAIQENEGDLEPSQKPYPNEHACRLRNPGDFQTDSFRRTQREHEGKKYSIIMGRLKGETTMTEQAYRYGKDVWKAAEARSHCKGHDGSFEAASGQSGVISQSEIKDELDYLKCAIIDRGINDEAKEQAWELVAEIMRLAGGDIPDDILEKVGAVLNQKNRERLGQIRQLAQEVLGSAESASEEPKHVDHPGLDKREIATVVAQVVAQMRGKII